MTSAKDITKSEENKPIKVKVEFEFENQINIKRTIAELTEMSWKPTCIIDLIKILEKYAK